MSSARALSAMPRSSSSRIICSGAGATAAQCDAWTPAPTVALRKR